MKFLTLILFFAFALVSSKTFGQIEPGKYYIEYLDRDEESLTIDSLGTDGRSKFIAYSDDNSCITLEINSNWKFENGIFKYSNQKEKQRIDCEEDFSPETSIASNSYKITEFGKGYFIGQSIESPDVILKWVKKN